jgi:hypothetical protein
MCIPLPLLGNGSVNKLYRGKKYARKNREIAGRVVFYTARIIPIKVDDWFFPELPAIHFIFIT